VRPRSTSTPRGRKVLKDCATVSGIQTFCISIIGGFGGYCDIHKYPSGIILLQLFLCLKFIFCRICVLCRNFNSSLYLLYICTFAYGHEYYAVSQQYFHVAYYPPEEEEVDRGMLEELCEEINIAKAYTCAIDGRVF
jgi:hypothetical protein